MESVEGKVLFLGDNIDTDQIIPGPYLRTLDYYEMASHAFEGLSPEANSGAQEAPIVIAGENFGCGSSREQAAIAIKYSGIKVVLAKYFARIFYRNAINLGIAVIEYDGPAPTGTSLETLATVDIENNLLLIDGREIALKPLPGFAKDIIESDGIIQWYKKKNE
jgi:3-isopropylmalate dehydratase small subunit